MAYVDAILKEEKRVCGQIDRRIREVEDEYLAMSTKLQTLANSIDGTRGFFARMGIRMRMKDIAFRMAWHRDVLVTLYDARWKRTYA